ncbi:hypothetical protein [Zhihengliuella sp.]|uniref:hypothetical protein n=1 Tax=Zhihengliuella sp. TaxID=1954483 RepID=UPI002810D026|nr:hypothetical protein [Zhihengliuella sp.]
MSLPTTPPPLSVDVFLDRATAFWAAPGLVSAPDELDGLHLLQLYIADGLLEALEWANQGVGSDEAACMWLAALRWHRRTTGAFPAGAPEPLDRWIDDDVVRGPGHRLTRAPGAVATALDRVEMGSTSRPNSSGTDSAAALLCAAVPGLLPQTADATARHLGTDAAALISQRSLFEPAATTAAAVRQLVSAQDARAVLAQLHAAHRDVPGLGPALGAVVTAAGPEGAADRLLAGTAAEDPGVLLLSLALAGAAHGTAALPGTWRDRRGSSLAVETARRWRMLVLPA